MSKSFKVWVEKSAFAKVMKSDGMKDACYEAASSIANKDPNFYATSYTGKKRAGANVWDRSSKLSNNLLKAVR